MPTSWISKSEPTSTAKPASLGCLTGLNTASTSMPRKVTVAAKPSTIPPILAKQNSPSRSRRRRNNLPGKGTRSSAERPPDPLHPFGHGKVPYFYSLLVAVYIFGVARCSPRDLATSPPTTVAVPGLELCLPGGGRCLRTLFVAHLVPRTPLKQRPRRDHLARNHWQQRPHNLHYLSGRLRGFDRCGPGLPGNFSRTNLPQPLLRSCRLHLHRTFAGRRFPPPRTRKRCTARRRAHQSSQNSPSKENPRRRSGGRSRRRHLNHADGTRPGLHGRRQLPSRLGCPAG